jgi:hypothetical protein
MDWDNVDIEESYFNTGDIVEIQEWDMYWNLIKKVYLIIKEINEYEYMVVDFLSFNTSSFLQKRVHISNMRIINKKEKEKYIKKLNNNNKLLEKNKYGINWLDLINGNENK